MKEEKLENYFDQCLFSVLLLAANLGSRDKGKLSEDFLTDALKIMHSCNPNMYVWLFKKHLKLSQLEKEK